MPHVVAGDILMLLVPFSILLCGRTISLVTARTDKERDAKVVSFWLLTVIPRTIEYAAKQFLSDTFFR